VPPSQDSTPDSREALERNDLRPRAQFDVGRSADAVDQYLDMLAASPVPRTSIHTLATCPARNTAACPGVAAADERHFLPAHAFASMGEAQYQTPRPSRAFRSAQSGRR